MGNNDQEITPGEAQLVAGRDWIREKVKELLAARGVTDCDVTFEALPRTFTELVVLKVNGKRKTLETSMSEIEDLPTDQNRQAIEHRLTLLVNDLLA